MSDLEVFGAMLKSDFLKDVSYILERVGINMEEKDKFLEQVKEKSKDEEILASMKFEDSLDYRFTLVEEDALERGIEQGIEQGIERGIERKTIDVILSMIEKNISLEDISDITGKTIEEIKEIVDSNKE